MENTINIKEEYNAMVILNQEAYVQNGVDRNKVAMDFLADFARRCCQLQFERDFDERDHKDILSDVSDDYGHLVKIISD